MQINWLYENEEWQELLVELVSELARKKYGFDASSISYEQAQQLMDAVLYCLQEYENGNPVLLSVQEYDIRKAYRAGYQMILDKMHLLQCSYNTLIPKFQYYGLHCLQDTIQKGIPAFCRYYDAKFAPQSDLLTLDYPVLSDCSQSHGIDRVWRYLQCIILEQEFLSRFSSAYISGVLQAYHADYANLVENICTIMLTNLIGHVLLQKPLSQCGFSLQEFERFTVQYAGLPQEEFVQQVRCAITQIVLFRDDTDNALLEYLLLEADNIAVRLQNAMTHETLCRMFLL